MVLAPGLETRKAYKKSLDPRCCEEVLSSQLCEVGGDLTALEVHVAVTGEFKSALNLRIFASFWRWFFSLFFLFFLAFTSPHARQVIAEGQYLLYNWLVKVLARYSKRNTSLRGRP